MPQEWLVGPIDNLKILLAASATFQAAVGADDAAEALAFIDEWESARTANEGAFAIVGSAGGRSRTKTSAASWANSGGDLFLVFVRPTDSDDQADPSAAGQTFAGVFEAIVDEMETLAGTDTYLNAIGWTENVPPTEGDVDLDPDAVPHWWAELGVEYR